MEHVGAKSVKGFNAMVVGRVPPSAGLSSSSALVCCAALTMVTVNDWKLSLVSTGWARNKRNMFITPLSSDQFTFNLLCTYVSCRDEMSLNDIKWISQ